MMEAGRLDRLVDLQSNTPTQSASGEQIDAWSAYRANLSAARMDERAAEFFAADQVVGQRATIWRIRYVPGLTSDMRIRHGAEVWEIRSIRELPGRQRGFDLYCVKLGA